MLLVRMRVRTASLNAAKAHEIIQCPTMKRLLKFLALLFALPAGMAVAQPAIISQGANDSFVSFQAEHYAYVSNALPTMWVIRNDVPASGTPASGGQALYASGEPQNTVTSSSFAYYALRFSSPGTYSLYLRWRADKVRSDQDQNGGNSYRRPLDFGDLPNDGTSSQFPVSSANNSRVPPDANKYAMIKEGGTYTVTQEQVDADVPLLFKIGTREWGMLLDRFVFSQSSTLTEADFNATPDSETSIIVQGQSENFVAFEAERVSLFASDLPTKWVAREDAPASGGRALYQAGEPQNTVRSSSFAYYSLKFSAPGTYRLYVRWRADKARSDQDQNGGNSYRRPLDFGDLANDDTSSQFPVSSANNSRVPPDANKYAMIKEGATYTVTQDQVDAGLPLMFKIGTREWGMFLDRFVLSVTDNLSEADFNATPNSGAAARPTLDKAIGSATLDTVTISFSKPLQPGSADPSFFKLSGGVAVVSATLDANDAKIIHLGTAAQTQGVRYTVTVSGVSDIDGNEILPKSTVLFTAWQLAEGWLSREFYYTVTGATIDSLINSPKFPDSPDSVDLVQSIAFENSPWADNYGVRFSTFFIPTVTDSYDFYLYNDDQAQLFLSTDETADGLQPLVDSPCCSSDFDVTRVGRSSGVLQAGHRYLFRALLKQGTAEVRLNVAARQAAQSAQPLSDLAPLGGNQIATFINPDVGAITIQQQPQNATARPGTRARFAVKAALGGSAVFYQWQLNGVDIPEANRSVFYTPILGVADNGKQYRVIVSASGVTATSASASLIVTGDPVVSDIQPFIGVNFVGGGTGGAGGILGPLDVAGVVQQQHFNNHRGSGAAGIELVDSTGTPTSVTLDVSATSVSFTGSGTSDGDHLLFQGYIHNGNAGSVKLTLNGVPDGIYNLYVYSVGFNFNSVFDQTYNLVGATTPEDLHITAQHAGDYAASSAFVRASSTNPDARDKGNYVIFENIRPDDNGSLLLSVTSESKVAGINFMPAVNAFQLASVSIHPALSVSTDGHNIGWGDNAAGFTVESTSSLGGSVPANWGPAAGVPNPVAGAGSIKIDTTTASRFYRLRR